jgi:2-dehydro-3-deoxyphosphogluconate aldolase/(4S)-4-hydroxy-2-oxoglutarate aldolase
MESRVFQSNVLERVKKSGIIAVLEIEDAENALPVVDALLEGGISAIELTLRTPSALDSIRKITKFKPEMTVGVGTVIFPEQVDDIIKAGAHFGVAPGLNPDILSKAKGLGYSFAPGVVTPSELEIALMHGCKVLKFFPAEPSGGISYLKSISNPYSYLDLTYIPLGGVNLSNLSEYAGMREVIAVGGTWIARRNTINDRDWKTITSNAVEAKKIWDDIRSKL